MPDWRGGVTTEATPTPEFEFHADEFSADDYPYGYFPVHERSQTMMSDEARSASNIGGDLFTKLDSLDDFFDDPPDNQHKDDDTRSSLTVTEYTPESFESGTQLYDEQILPILHQASTNTSLPNGFSDRPPALSREGSSNTMNPGAFNAIASPRPGLQARSVTLPVGGAPAPAAAPAGGPGATFSTGEIMSDDEIGNEEVFSDADDERPNTSGGEGSSFITNMVRRPPQGLGFRPPPRRRLTGGRHRDGARMDRPPPMNSSVPTIPNLPNVYNSHMSGQGDML